MRQIFAELCSNSRAFLQTFIFRISILVFSTIDVEFVHNSRSSSTHDIFEAPFLSFFGLYWRTLLRFVFLGMICLPTEWYLKALLLHTTFWLLQSSAKVWLVCLSLYHEQRHHQQYGKSVETVHIISGCRISKQWIAKFLWPIYVMS